MDERLLAKIGEVEREHWWFVVRRKIVIETLEGLGVGDDAHVVEIGCGTGGTLAELSRRHPGWRCQGIEPSPSACRAARGRGCAVTQGALPDVPLADTSVDCAIALDVLEHCKDDEAAAREIERILRPGAPLIATVPALPSLWSVHDVDNAHYRRYTRPALAEALEAAGFQVERVTYFNTLLLPLGYASRLASRVTGSRKTLGVDVPPKPLNAALRTVFGIEAHAIRRIDLPVGMSLLAVARKRPAC